MNQNIHELFTRLVHEHTAELLSKAVYKTNSQEIAQDLVQETFLSAFKNYSSFQNKSHIRTWLFSILNNKIIDYYKKKKEFRLPENINESDAIELTESLFDESGKWKVEERPGLWHEDANLLDNEEFQTVFTNCLNELPDNWHQAIAGKYLSDSSTEEICQELGITPSNYWQILHRAKLMLRKCIQKNWIQ